MCGTRIFQGETSERIWIASESRTFHCPSLFSRKPAGVLKGHRAPVSYLCVSSEDGQIFSVSVDNAVKVMTSAFFKFFFCFRNGSMLSARCPQTCVVGVGGLSDVVVDLLALQVWDIQEQNCLLTVDSEESGIHGDITACSYSSATKSLYVAAGGVAALSLKTRSAAAPLRAAFLKEPSPVL